MTTKALLTEARKMAFIRFLRTAIPQVPAVCAYLVGLKPEWAAGLALIGAIVTAIDKYLREIGVYA
jgi:hypothetical protein